MKRKDQGVTAEDLAFSRDSHVKPPERPTNHYSKERKVTKKEISPSNLSYLEPKQTVQINGKLSYKEGLQAWNVIQLQKEIIDLFPQLREKRSAFGYTMYYNREAKEAKKILEKLEKQGIVPIMLLLGKVKESH